MSEEASERTPLLAEEPATIADPPQAATPAGTSNDNTSADEHYARLRRRFVILTSISVFLSVVAFASSTAVEVLVAQFAPPGWWMDWTTTDMNRYMVVTTIVTAFIGFLNLVRLYNANRPLGLLFNIICDLVFMFYLFTCSIGILTYTISRRFSCHSRYSDDDDDEACLPFARAVRALFIVASGSGLILGFIFLALFLIRCVLMYNLRPWSAIQRTNGRWSVPAGVLTFEFSIKFLRQEEHVETNSRE